MPQLFVSVVMIHIFIHPVESADDASWTYRKYGWPPWTRPDRAAGNQLSSPRGPNHKRFISSGLKFFTITCAQIFILIIQSGHNFAHVTTAELCRIVIWLNYPFSCKGNTCFYDFGLWAHKPFVKQVPNHIMLVDKTMFSNCLHDVGWWMPSGVFTAI